MIGIIKADKPVHFYQIWIFPDESGLKPTYDQKHFEAGNWRNRLLPVASGQNIDWVVTFHTDATIYRFSLDSGKEAVHKAIDGRRIFIYLTDGQITANSETLDPKDQARIDIEEPLILRAQQQSEIILIDIPSCKGRGYSTETLKGQKKQ